MVVSRGALLTLTDQVLSSATNFVPALFAAHALSPRAFGTFALLQASYVLLIGAVRSGFVETAVVATTSGSNHRGFPTSCAIWLSIAVLAPMSLVALALSSQAILLSTVALGLVVVQDTQRIENLSSGREADAAVSDLIWLIMIAGIVALCVIKGWSPDADTLFQLWAVGALPGTLAVGLLRRNLVGPRASLRFVSGERATVLTHVGDWALRQGLTQTTLYVVATAAGLSVVGNIRLAQLLLGPINILFAAVQLVAMPRVARAAKDSWDAFRGLLIRLATAQFLLPLMFGLVIVALPLEALRLALGDQAVGLKTYLVPQVVLLSVSGAAATAQIGIKVLRLRLELLRTRVATCAVTLASTLVLALALDSALAALWGLALGSAISAVIWQYILWTNARQQDYVEV
ncbi:hypothetical protein [Nocardioides sp.]|uniref:hypothetical protein n=1 Tax=Nocardioides sp. TaxID=35761 RepID=UPI0031FE6CA0|nr:hypothetical protein [Nocardioides sp.]